VKGSFLYTAEMRRSGISIPWIQEHLIQDARDYGVLRYIYENIRVEPAYDGYQQWADAIGEKGMPVAYGLTAGSPMHHIMKILLDATDFYYRYRDQRKEMMDLAEGLGVYFRNVIDVIASGPAEVCLIGANFDDMLTYPPFFKDHILPWLREAADKLHAKNKLMLCHTDGENKGLMDLLLNSGMDIADSVCPHPMTKVTLAEYYRQWGEKVTIFGGIPSNLMLEETTSDEQFESFMDELFTAIAPGTRIILGVADTTPPDASFDRLRRIHDLVQQYGRLPLTGKTQPAPGISKAEETGQQPGRGQREEMPEPRPEHDLPICGEIIKAVMAGNDKHTVDLVREAVAQAADPEYLLKKCLLAPMDIIGERFSDGTVFIPEVLLAARALNQAMEILEPHMAEAKIGGADSPLVVIGTVKGDLHDIGKNLVGIMLRSVGFRVLDLGVNVAIQQFVSAVKQEQPAILALSALLTTTMPEIKKVIQAVADAGMRETVKIMVGGAPVSEHFARNIGADAYGADAGQAASQAKRLCGMG